MRAAGHRIPAPLDHSRASADNLGWVERVWREGDTLLCEVDFPRDADESRIGSTIREVSICVEPEWTDSTGKVWKDFISHIAPCTEPVIPGQGEFVRVAARNQDDQDIVICRKESPSMDWKDKVAGLLKLENAGDLTDDQVAAELEKKLGQHTETLRRAKTERDNAIEVKRKSDEQLVPLRCSSFSSVPHVRDGRATCSPSSAPGRLARSRGQSVLGEQLPALQAYAPPGDGLEEAAVVADRDHGQVELVEDADDALLALFVEPGGRLVEQERLRLHGEDRGEADHLLLAKGELGCDALGKAAHAEPVERGKDDGARLFRGLPEVERPEGHVVGHRGAEELVVGVLKEQADPCPHVEEVLFPDAGRAKGQYLAGRWPEQTDAEVEERGLAAAGGADEADLVAVREVEGQGLEHRTVRVIAERDGPKAYQRVHCIHPSAPRTPAAAAAKRTSPRARAKRLRR